jgi:hypothetical protein
MDLSVDFRGSSDVYTASGGCGRATMPPAIRREITRTEVEQRESFNYKPSGGAEASKVYFQVSGSSRQIYALNAVVRNKLKVSLDTVINAFGFTMVELASVLKVGRKTVYNWADATSIPSPNNAKRIYNVLSVAEAWRNAGYDLYKVNPMMASAGGVKVIDLLRRDAIDKEQILFAGAKAQMGSVEHVELLDPFA